jgi:hypothetical protein
MLRKDGKAGNRETIFGKASPFIDTDRSKRRDLFRSAYFEKESERKMSEINVVNFLYCDAERTASPRKRTQQLHHRLATSIVQARRPNDGGE